MHLSRDCIGYLWPILSFLLPILVGATCRRRMFVDVDRLSALNTAIVLAENIASPGVQHQTPLGGTDWPSPRPSPAAEVGSWDLSGTCQSAQYSLIYGQRSDSEIYWKYTARTIVLYTYRTIDLVCPSIRGRYIGWASTSRYLPRRHGPRVLLWVYSETLANFGRILPWKLCVLQGCLGVKEDRDSSTNFAPLDSLYTSCLLRS